MSRVAKIQTKLNPLVPKFITHLGHTPSSVRSSLNSRNSNFIPTPKLDSPLAALQFLPLESGPTTMMTSRSTSHVRIGERYPSVQGSNFASMMKYERSVAIWMKIVEKYSAVRIIHSALVRRMLIIAPSTENKEKRCPNLPPPDDDSRMAGFRDQILVSHTQ